MSALLKGGDYQPGADAIQVMTMKVSKGLEFPVVALPGVGHMPAPGEDEKEAARVFDVAATRDTQRLMMTVGGDERFLVRLISYGFFSTIPSFAGESGEEKCSQTTLIPNCLFGMPLVFHLLNGQLCQLEKSTTKWNTNDKYAIK